VFQVIELRFNNGMMKETVIKRGFPNRSGAESYARTRNRGYDLPKSTSDIVSFVVKVQP